MDLDQALRYLSEHIQPGVLVTLFEDGRPQTSVVTAAVVDGRLWISATQTRVKTRNVRRDPRVVFTLGTGPWIAVEGAARVQDGDDVLERMRLYYRTAAGEHPNWDEYDEAMRRDQRLIIEIEPTRAYGMGV